MSRKQKKQKNQGKNTGDWVVRTLYVRKGFLLRIWFKFVNNRLTFGISPLYTIMVGSSLPKLVLGSASIINKCHYPSDPCMV